MACSVLLSTANDQLHLLFMRICRVPVYETLFTNEVMHPFVNEDTSYNYILTTGQRNAFAMTESLSCMLHA